MKKILILVLAFLIIGLIGGWYVYRVQIPKMAASAIIKGEYSAFVPQKIQRKINKIRDSLNNQIEEVLTITDTLGISIEDILAGLEEVDKQEVINTYEQIKETKPSTTSQVFQIAYDNIKISAFDPMVLRGPFVKHAKMKQITRAMQYVEDNDLLDNLDMDLMRRTAKEILLQKKEEILKRTDKIKF